jgi:hypothetical protein
MILKIVVTAAITLIISLFLVQATDEDDPTWLALAVVLLFFSSAITAVGSIIALIWSF